MKREHWLATSIVFCLLIGLGAYLIPRLEWKDVKQSIPATGEARHNPYHAAIELLKRLGYKGERLQAETDITTLATHTTLLLAEPESFHADQQREKVLQWVQAGGHVVLPVTFSDKQAPLLKQLGLSVTDIDEAVEDNAVVTLEADSLKLNVESASALHTKHPLIMAGRLPVGENADEDDEDEDEATPSTATAAPQPAAGNAILVRYRLGKGFVTAGHLASIRNNTVGKLDHAKLAVRALTLADEARPIYVLIAPEYPSLLAWLASHGAEAIVGLTLLILASLWYAAPRFGPTQPAHTPARPGLKEHISACGNFLLQQRAYEQLIVPLQEDVTLKLKRLFERHPESESAEHLATQLSGANIATVRHALTGVPESLSDFHAQTQLLAHIRQQCQQSVSSVSDHHSTS